MDDLILNILYSLQRFCLRFAPLLPFDRLIVKFKDHEIPVLISREEIHNAFQYPLNKVGRDYTWSRKQIISQAIFILKHDEYVVCPTPSNHCVQYTAQRWVLVNPWYYLPIQLYFHKWSYFWRDLKDQLRRLQPASYVLDVPMDADQDWAERFNRCIALAEQMGFKPEMTIKRSETLKHTFPKSYRIWADEKFCTFMADCGRDVELASTLGDEILRQVFDDYQPVDIYFGSFDQGYRERTGMIKPTSRTNPWARFWSKRYLEHYLFFGWLIVLYGASINFSQGYLFLTLGLLPPTIWSLYSRKDKRNKKK